jgi:hypothetical protein
MPSIQFTESGLESWSTSLFALSGGEKTGLYEGPGLLALRTRIGRGRQEVRC